MRCIQNLKYDLRHWKKKKEAMDGLDDGSAEHMTFKTILSSRTKSWQRKHEDIV